MSKPEKLKPLPTKPWEGPHRHYVQKSISGAAGPATGTTDEKINWTLNAIDQLHEHLKQMESENENVK